MIATVPAHKQPFLSAFQGLKTFRPSLASSRRRARTVDREEAARDCMSPPALDVLELLSGEGCVSDWGLVERAARLRDGWA